MILSTQEIENLTSELEEDSIQGLDELELEELKTKSYSNALLKAKLFYYCYELINDNLHLFGEYKQKVKEHLNKFENYKEFSESMNEYLSDSYGQYFIIPRLKNYISDNSQNIKELIDLFFEIFYNED